MKRVLVKKDDLTHPFFVGEVFQNENYQVRRW